MKRKSCLSDCARFQCGQLDHMKFDQELSKPVSDEDDLARLCPLQFSIALYCLVFITLLCYVMLC